MCNTLSFIGIKKIETAKIKYRFLGLLQIETDI